MTKPEFQNKIDQYFLLRQEIFDHVGYKEDYRVMPLVDSCLNDYWLVTGEGEGDKYAYSSEPFSVSHIKAGNDLYGGWIYTQRFLKKWVFRGEYYTLVCGDPREDCNILLYLFDNAKECKNKKLIELYGNRWQHV